ncbi:MAG: phosphotransferase [Lachnospiraceae bacterium]|nr:phosphotransferase [Lachnospiraceae bacterium]
MTGELKSVSVDGLKEIGRGMTSRVYQLDEDKIIKVFYPGRTVEEIEEERSASRRAFIKGVPTAITYQLVRVDDSYGIIYELIEADTLAGTIHKSPEKLESYAKKAADVLIGLHHTEYAKGELPDTREVWLHLCEIGLVNYLSGEEWKRLRDFLMGLPERNTFIHGDFHALNIMVRNDELILIDVGDASLGHPVLDLASVYMACVLLPKKATSEQQKSVMIMTADEWQAFWNAFIRAYLKTDDAKVLREAETQIKRFATLRMCITHALLPGRNKEQKAEYIKPKIEQLFAEMNDIRIIP